MENIENDSHPQAQSLADDASKAIRLALEIEVSPESAGPNQSPWSAWDVFQFTYRLDPLTPEQVSALLAADLMRSVAHIARVINGRGGRTGKEKLTTSEHVPSNQTSFRATSNKGGVWVTVVGGYDVQSDCQKLRIQVNYGFAAPVPAESPATLAKEAQKIGPPAAPDETPKPAPGARTPEPVHT